MGGVSGVTVLREVAVCRDDRTVKVAGFRLRALLTLLAVAPGEVRRNDYLADQLWNGEPPSVNALHALISRLRRVLGSEAVVSRPAGYLLDVAPELVDLTRFEQLSELGTLQAAREALALAGPEPLAEFADVADLAGLSRVLQVECARLERLAQRAAPSVIAAEKPRAAPASEGGLDGGPVLTGADGLIGRDRLLSEIRRRLGRARLLTLTGAGGCGKTSLAGAVAGAHEAAHVAELATVTAQGVDAEVCAAVAGRENVLGAAERARQPGSRDDAARVCEALGERPALLVLDNCEHVIDAAAGLAAKVLAACPRVTILATSREPLGVPGEQRLPVDPLAVPPVGCAQERLTEYSAMQLLLERGRAVRPDLDAVGEDRAALAEICRRLDGIPLALELAAARFNVLTPQQIDDRLDDRFRLLTTGARTALPRQQTLRAVVDWSWELLSPGERELLAACGVFAGGASLEDLEGVCGLGAPDVLDLIDRLVTKSLVVAEPASTRGRGAMRYRLLETIREYAVQCLAEQGRERQVRSAHAYYFARLAERADPQLRGPGQVEWIDRLDAAEDNLRTALDWALAERDAACALRLCGGLAWYGMVRGRQVDRGRAPQALALAEQSGLQHDQSYLRVSAFDALHALERGVSPQEATARLRRARQKARDGDWRDALYSLAELGAALVLEPDSVGEVFTREYTRLSGTGDAWGVAATRLFYAKACRGDPESAEALTGEALAGFHRLGDQWGIANCGQTMAVLTSQRGAHREALAVIEAALPATGLIGSASDEVMLLVMAATEYDSLGEAEEAGRELTRAREVSRSAPEDEASLALTTYECVRARRAGRLDQAQVCLDEASEATVAGFGPVQVLHATQRAWIALGRGEVAEADRLIREAFEHALALHFDRADLGAVIEARAALELARGGARRAAWLHGLHAAVRGRDIALSATPDLARTAAEAVRRLGRQAYDAAFEDGRAVPSTSVLARCQEFFALQPGHSPRDHDAE